MQRPAFRITIRSTIGQSPVEQADSAAGPFLLGAIRACRGIRIMSLTIERKAVTLITFQEPTAEQLQALQQLGDTFERATTAPRERAFAERVKMEEITAEHPAEDETENATATVESVLSVGPEDTLGYRASEVTALIQGLSKDLTDAEVIHAIEAHPNIHDCEVRHSDSGKRSFVFRVKPSDLDRAAGDRYKHTRYEVEGASMGGPPSPLLKSVWRQHSAPADIADPTPKVDPADVEGLTLKAIK